MERKDVLDRVYAAIATHRLITGKKHNPRWIIMRMRTAEIVMDMPNARPYPQYVTQWLSYSWNGMHIWITQDPTVQIGDVEATDVRPEHA